MASTSFFIDVRCLDEVGEEKKQKNYNNFYIKCLAKRKSITK